MPRRFVDLSIFLENDGVSDPPAFAPKIEYFTHRTTYAQIEPFFPGLKQEDLPDGEGWAVERAHLSTHNGTHLDAPYHFHSTMNRALGGQERAIAIDEVPLEWCFQPGVKLDFRHLPDGHVVNKAAKVDPRVPDFKQIRFIDYDDAKYGASNERKRLIGRWEKDSQLAAALSFLRQCRRDAPTRRRPRAHDAGLGAAPARRDAGSARPARLARDRPRRLRAAALVLPAGRLARAGAAGPVRQPAQRQRTGAGRLARAALARGRRGRTLDPISLSYPDAKAAAQRVAD